MYFYKFKFIFSIFLLSIYITGCSTPASYEGEYRNGKYHGKGSIVYGNGDQYEGNFQYGQRHGYGTYFYENGAKLAGTFINGSPSYGSETFTGKWKDDLYVGNFKKWKRDGEGTYTWGTGTKYVGLWKNGKRNGLGILTYTSGKVKEGVWEDGKYQYYKKINNSPKKDINRTIEKKYSDYSNKELCSKATKSENTIKKWYFEKTSLFVKEAKRRGLDCGVNNKQKYVLSLTDKRLCYYLKLYKNYENSFTSEMTFYQRFFKEADRRGLVCGVLGRTSYKSRNDKPNSIKKSHSRNINNYLSSLPKCSDRSKNKHMCFGKKITKRYEYIGEFKNNMRHGKGKYTHIANDKFKGYIHIGEYLNNKRHGYGEAKWVTGEEYTGQYVKGLPNGFGIYKYANGDRYEGNFINDKMDGEGRYFHENGKIREGIWKNGRFKYAKKISKSNNLIANKTKPKVDYDELYASKREIEKERNKRIELERRLASLLAKQKEERDLIDADIRVPILEIISNNTKGKRGTIRGVAKDNVKVAEVTIDGKEVNISPNGNFEYSTYVPPSGVKLKIEVTDLAGLTTSKIVELRGNLELASPTISFDRLNPLSKRVKSNPNALALIVGVSKYENTNAKAMYADNDALVFKDYAVEKLGIKPGKIKVLLNKKADEKEILLSIKEWLRRSAKPNQSDIYVFFAGHGLASDDGKNMYLLPYDGEPRLLEKTAILRNEMFSDIKEAKPKSVTIFLDTCYSGVTRNEEMLIAGRPIAIKAKEQAIPDGFTLFSAASNEQISRPLEEAKHGMFSYFLMKGMEGDADANNDNKITARELHVYVEQNVVQQSSGSQTPELQGNKDRVLVQFN